MYYIIGEDIMKIAKVIKLPSVLLAMLKEELDSHFAYFLKNVDYTRDREYAEDETEYLKEIEDTFNALRKAKSYDANLKEIYYDFVDAVERMDINVHLISFEEYKRMLEYGKFSELLNYTSKLKTTLTNVLHRYDLFGRFGLEYLLKKPDPFYHSKDECESKKIILKNSHFKDLPYLKNYDIDPMGYTLSLLTVKTKPGMPGKCVFTPQLKEFTIMIPVDSNTLVRNPNIEEFTIHEILEHELTHLIQLIMRDLTKIEEWGQGSRKFKNNDTKNPDWFDLNIEYKSQLKDMYSRAKILHSRSKIDISSLSSFEKGIQQNINYFRLLEHLKKNNPKKYLFVVRELYKHF
jgi:hypothetical protein